MLETGALDVDMFRKLAVDRFINRRNTIKVPTEGFSALDMWGNEGQLADTVNFFFKITKEKDLPDRYEVIPEFVKNLIPVIRIRGFKYYGPGEFLGEMSFGEYKDLLFCADKFIHTKDEYWLTRMMAIAYRKRRFMLGFVRLLSSFNGRTRRKYMPGATDYIEKRFDSVPIGVKYMFFQYIMGCVYTLKTDGGGQGIEIDGKNCKFSLVFSRPSKKSEGLYDDDEQGDDGIGLTGVIMALAESGVFGDIDKTSSANVWDVLIRLYQLEVQRREMERKMK
ncbi:MAG TPA: hypothetical protein DCL77_14615 [Prolixibacteraceae bacterium]|nr:hypothetical protein [Prolixibacteraceae bacterium]